MQDEHDLWPRLEGTLAEGQRIREEIVPTAFGKTGVAANLIAKRGVNTLILVHRQTLLEQWRARLAVFLDIPLKAIGKVAGGKDARTGLIDVALLHSLQRRVK